MLLRETGIIKGDKSHPLFIKLVSYSKVATCLSSFQSTAPASVFHMYTFATFTMW